MRESELTLAEAVQLSATNGQFFARYFFPKTMRQEPPEWDRPVWNLLDDPSARYTVLKMFRGAAKTTRARVFTAKRTAFGLSRTILYVGKSQDHAARSVDWLKKNIQTNAAFSQGFRLRPGSKWTDIEIEVVNELLGTSTRILAYGITGPIRGINIDDYRPDCIIGDDLVDEENSNTPEGREKIEDLWFGALKESLAPASECPDAKQLLLGTPIHGGDLVDKCSKDPSYRSITVSVFNEDGESSWPARWSTEELRREKQQAVEMNKLSLWLREKECKIVSKEEASFRSEWLQPYTELPRGLVYYIGVDPTPPPKDKNATQIRRLDDAAIVVIGVRGPNVYLVSYYITKSPDPEEFIKQLFSMVMQYKPYCVGFESILFARTTKTMIEKEMLKRRLFFNLIPVEDKRKKMLRIEQAITGRAAGRTIHVSLSHGEFKEQFELYPNVAHDDLLDAFSIAVELINPAHESSGEDVEESEDDYPDLEAVAGGCP